MFSGTRQLSVKRGNVTVLDRLSLTIPRGKRLAIIGPNGAGKSTLLRVLAGIDRSYEGEVIIDGQNLRDLTRRQTARRIAFLPQGAAAPPDMTVRQIVTYGRYAHRAPWAIRTGQSDRKAVDNALTLTSMTDLQDRPMGALSGGERQRAFLALALAQEPAYLLLDEPTTYLDLAHQIAVMQIIRDLNSRLGMTVIMVLHDINHALQYADETAVLANHTIAAQGPSDQIIDTSSIASVFGVRAERFTGSGGRSVYVPVGLTSKANIDNKE